MGRLRIENTNDQNLSVEGYVKVVDEIITDPDKLEDFTDSNPRKRVRELIRILDNNGAPVGKATLTDRTNTNKNVTPKNCRIRIQREDRGRKTLVAIPLAEMHISNTNDTDTKDFEYLNSYINTLLEELQGTGAFNNFNAVPTLKANPTQAEKDALERVRKFLFGIMMFTRCR